MTISCILGDFLQCKEPKGIYYNISFLGPSKVQLIFFCYEQIKDVHHQKNKKLGSQKLIKMNHKYTCTLMTPNDVSKVHKSCAIRTLFTHQTVSSFNITKSRSIGRRPKDCYLYFFNFLGTNGLKNPLQKGKRQGTKSTIQFGHVTK